jgi:two-component system chemotaxis response regulator CheB
VTIAVMVVDDSVVVRRLITDALDGMPNIKVVGTASNGRLAQAKVDQLKPDVITMDIEMPEMNGIEAVRELRKRHPKIPVIMFSTLSAAGASATLDALAAGATDYVTKPANVGSVQASIQAVRDQLVPKIHALAGRRGGPPMAGRPPARPMAPARPGYGPGPAVGRPGLPPLAGGPAPSGGAGAPSGRIDLIAVGCSTGGPDALARVVQSFPADLPVPVVVTQHMPPVFTKMFAERLDRTNAIQVVEATENLTLKPGVMYIAPGDRHLVLVKRGTGVLTQLSTAPPENSCRPAVDVMFRAVGRAYGPSTLAVILTGMGQDGRNGCQELRAAGAEIVAQDEATSVVWGMPGAVVTANLAHTVLPLDQIGPYLTSRVNAGRTARPKVVTR